LSGEVHESYHIRDFAEVHSNIEDKLNDLTQIIFKYLPANASPKESIELVFDIFQLSTDLNKHTLIEDKILVPYVEMLER
jgi:transcriptional regulator, luxR family domain protein